MATRLWARVSVVPFLATLAWADVVPSTDEMLEQARRLGETPVSCETLMIYDNADDPSGLEGRQLPVAFGVDDCAGLVTTTSARQLLRPVGDFAFQLAKMQEQQRKVTGVDASAQARNWPRFYNEVRRNFAPLFKACLQLGSTKKVGSSRTCFFGAPRPSSGAVFKAAFGYHVAQGIRDEALCVSTEPGGLARAEPEFSRLREQFGLTVSWGAARSSMENDGFYCWIDEGNETCTRMVLSVILPGSLQDRQADQELFSNGAAIVPRIISVYQGTWAAGSLGMKCLTFKDGMKSGDCEPKPERGSETGICLKPFDAGLLMGVVMLNMREWP